MMATRTVATVDADLQALKSKVNELAALIAALQPAPSTNSGSLSFNIPANSGLVGAI